MKEQDARVAKRKLHKETVLMIVAVLLPAIMAGVIALYYAIRTGSCLPMPQWNDEAVYYAQVKMWIEQGASKGYWGFNGGHAIWGTGGAWNPAILLPYVIVGKVFGWGYSSVAIWNVMFLCVANAVVLKIGQTARFAGGLILVEVLSLHLWLYMNTIMSEVLRFAYAIVLAALIYKGLFGAQKPTMKWKIGCGIYLLYLLQVYIFFAFAIPLYVFVCMRGSKVWKKLVASLLVTTVTAGSSYGLLHMISSNYNIYKTEQLLEALKNGQIGTAIIAFLQMAKAGLGDLWYCFLGTTGHGLFRWYVVFLVMLAVGPLVLFGMQWKKAREAFTEGSENPREYQDTIGRPGIRMCYALLTVSYSVILFTGMYITVYSLEAFTFFRGTGIVVLFSLVMLLMAYCDTYGTDDEAATLAEENRQSGDYSELAIEDNRTIAYLLKEKRASFLSILLSMLCYAVGMVFLLQNMTDFNAERYVSAETRAEWTALGEQLSQTMQVCEEADIAEIHQKVSQTAAEDSAEETSKDAARWKNTAVLYTLEPKLITALPAGIGQNYMMYSDEIFTDAEYLIFSLCDAGTGRGDWLEQSYFSIYAEHAKEIDSRYFIQFTDGDYIIYKKKAE